MSLKLKLEMGCKVRVRLCDGRAVDAEYKNAWRFPYKRHNVKIDGALYFADKFIHPDFKNFVRIIYPLELMGTPEIKS